ncbi:protein phosphatase 1 regulatory subunit 3E [Huso huso]|uniref:Protein phosphatase 1 regulatory subunit 3E n=1 Tax=Huso huso TaxID=61971 RepID=A0ABR0Y5E5_HUSHU
MDGHTDSPKLRSRIPRPLTCAEGLSESIRGRDSQATPPLVSPRRRARSAPAHSQKEPIRRWHSPDTRKRVRFADWLGLELTSVIHYSQQSQDQDSDSEKEGSDWSTQDTPTASKEPMTWPSQHLPSQSCFAEPQFSDPVSRPEFHSLVRERRICLESARVESLCVSGSARVLNLAFQKEVCVRYSLDNWATYSEIQASYLPPSRDTYGFGIGDSVGMDRFHFRLPLPPRDPPYLKTGHPEQLPSLEFALCYRVLGQEYWDSNEGVNYAVCWRTMLPPSMLTDENSAWIHFI